MALIFGLSEKDTETLHTAALLHDITKEKTPGEQITLCRVYQIEYTETYLSTPALFHAKTGAEYALEQFKGTVTKEAAELIRTHTTGCVNMTLMQKLLLLADGIEKTRKHDSLVSLRSYFYENPGNKDLICHLNDTVIRYFDLTVRFLLESGQVIDNETISARNDLIIKRGK